MTVTKKKYGVFISYSHEDAKLVSPVVKLITVLRKDLVFQDTKDLQPGKEWGPQLQKALDEAGIVIVFWCEHAAKSAYVKKEYKCAIKKKKDVLPLLLDNTKLTDDLSKYQWIDFRDTKFHDEKIDHLSYLLRVGERVGKSRFTEKILTGIPQENVKDNLKESTKFANAIIEILKNLNEKLPPL